MIYCLINCILLRKHNYLPGSYAKRLKISINATAVATSFISIIEKKSSRSSIYTVEVDSTGKVQNNIDPTSFEN